MKAVIMAGGKLDADLANQTGLTWRSQLVYRDRSFLQISIDALAPFADINVVGGIPSDAYGWIEGGQTFFDSFQRACAMGGDETFLLASADVPFLTADAVQDFLVKTKPYAAALHYPIVDVNLVNQKYPGMARTSLKLKEGGFTGGNVFLVDGKLMKRVLPKMEEAYQARKNVLRLGSLLGLPTLVAIIGTKLLPGSVRIAHLEATIGRSLGAPVKAIISEFPGIAADIDSSDHFAWLQTL